MEPEKVTLEIGKEYWWNCEVGETIWPGEDAAFPMHCTDCILFTADREEAYICRCKQTSTPPYCDGTHQKLKA